MMRKSDQGARSRVILAFLLVLMLSVNYWGCAGNRSGAEGAQSLVRGNAVEDSSGTDQKAYLKVKFHQNDTEVELILDPEATNLALDFVRGADGKLQVFQGDSALIGDPDAPEQSDEGLLEKLTRNPEALDSEDLTDEIIQDINLAQRLFYQKQYEEALRVLQASLQKKKSATAYALGGSIYYVNGDIDEAVNAWENALRINPDLPDVRELVNQYKQ